MICVDASLALKWLFPEEHSDTALVLLDAQLAAGERIVAPPLLPIEVTNTIRQRMRSSDLSLSDAQTLLDQFFSFPVTILTPIRLSYRALEIADLHQLPAVYDAHYVALAEMLNCALWTDDRRLLRLLGSSLPFVQWIGDYTP